MEVITLRALQDNYMYLIIDTQTKMCAAVDPVFPDVILNAVKENGLILTTVLTTHHHSDHADGNKELAQKWATLIGKQEHELVICGGCKRVQACNKIVMNNENISLGKNLNVKCLFTPCHTKSHFCYFVTNKLDDKDVAAVFTGDTLFLAGCGRFFEGTGQEMYTALVEILGKLPASTRVYCGHEYTRKNLEFALIVEPSNAAIGMRLQKVNSCLAAGQPTVPGTIGEELDTNPFMRVDLPQFKEKFATSNSIEVMTKVRAQKDAF